jgi:CheY-like chemotaxis protein
MPRCGPRSGANRAWAGFNLFSPFTHGAASARPRPTLLLVEDREDDVFFFRRALSRLSAEVDVQVVGNVTQAQHYLRGTGEFTNREYFRPADIIVCDCNAVAGDGFKLLRWVRGQKEFRPLPFVLLSGSSVVHAAQATELGATLVLGKTPVFDQAVRQARRILDLLKSGA